MGPSDRRFGFSVMGGIDEGFPPRIDDIAPGTNQIVKYLYQFISIYLY